MSEKRTKMAARNRERRVTATSTLPHGVQGTELSLRNQVLIVSGSWFDLFLQLMGKSIQRIAVTRKVVTCAILFDSDTVLSSKSLTHQECDKHS